MICKPRSIRPLAERFWSKVDRRGQDECWPWKGRLGAGYGRFRLGRAGSRSDHPMRVAYALVIGPVPKGLHVCHRCDNPPCCNPSHLWLGTSQQNTADKMRKGRQAMGPIHGSKTMPHRVARGTRNGMAKLSWRDVTKIRVKRALFGQSYAVLAEEFGVDKTQIMNIVLRRQWSGAHA